MFQVTARGNLGSPTPGKMFAQVPSRKELLPSMNLSDDQTLSGKLREKKEKLEKDVSGNVLSSKDTGTLALGYGRPAAWVRAASPPTRMSTSMAARVKAAPRPRVRGPFTVTATMPGQTVPAETEQAHNIIISLSDSRKPRNTTRDTNRIIVHTMISVSSQRSLPPPKTPPPSTPIPTIGSPPLLKSSLLSLSSASQLPRALADSPRPTILLSHPRVPRPALLVSRPRPIQTPPPPPSPLSALPPAYPKPTRQRRQRLKRLHK
ncbi:uncharacterized protein LOC134784573 [Penaeus indicus]|uniref:uncharacterized protein LOC134784573 n=1 Tax=Penaeus indicus TaxID=29960 RepID=UPI00300D0F9B